MKHIKRINEFFKGEEEIERDEMYSDEEEGDFDLEDDNFSDEEEGDFDLEDEEDVKWGDEPDSSMSSNTGLSNLQSFGDFNSDSVNDLDDFGYEDESFDEEEGEGDEDFDFSDEEEGDFDLEDDNFSDEEEGDEDEFSDMKTVESFRSFNEKMNPGFKAFLDKQKAKRDKKAGKGKGKPDFLDLDKDGDKKEPMKKAAKEAKKKK